MDATSAKLKAEDCAGQVDQLTGVLITANRFRRSTSLVCAHNFQRQHEIKG